MSMIDLHTHSTASDGSLSPSDLVALARKSGLSALALTDHDTAQGLPEAVAAGRDLGVEVVPGCELSVADPPFRVHIVGLFLPERPEKVTQALEFLRQKRHDRNHVIIEKLRAAGVDITYDEVRQRASGSVGRPHFAAVLVDKGRASGPQDAFDKYLGEHGLAYVPKEKFDLATAVAALRSEGATVVLAHPYMLRRSGRDLEKILVRYKQAGVDGIEVYYPEHSEGQTMEYQSLARRLDMAVSGGSDFHGAAKPDIRLGLGRGKLHIPESVLEAMKDRRRRQGLPV